MEESLSITPVSRLRSTSCFYTVTDFVSRRMSLKTPIAVVTQYGLRAATFRALDPENDPDRTTIAD